MKSVTACVVGVILNLTVWFALHVLFKTVTDRHVGILKLTVPDPASLDILALALSATAVALLFGLHRGVIATLSICAALSVAAKILM